MQTDAFNNTDVDNVQKKPGPLKKLAFSSLGNFCAGIQSSDKGYLPINFHQAKCFLNSQNSLFF